MNQKAGSNNQKLLSIFADSAVDTKNNLFNIYACRQLVNAKGGQLDNIAADYGISRIDDDDDFLRFLIRAKILQNKIGSTTNELKKLISVLLNIPIDRFDFEATENPEELKITNIPFQFDSGSKLAVKRRMVSDVIQRSLPPEYNLLDIRYSKNAKETIYYAISSSRAKVRESTQKFDYKQASTLQAFIATNSMHIKIKNRKGGQ